MRRYEMVYADGTIRYFDAEMDTLKEGVVILSKQKEHKGEILRADVKPEIVRIISLHNIKDYGYEELG